jgi:OFA family oxalate/formate antiporter-like MFS transporter
MNKNKFFREAKMGSKLEVSRWWVVVGGIIVQIVLGTVYAFSVFVKPLELEFGWDRTTTQWAFSFALATFAITMIPAGRLQDKIGPRKVAMIGGILLGASFLLSALLVRGNLPWILYVTYGIIGGAGIGFGYVCPISAALKWFPDKRGLITGLSVAGFGAGALFFAGPATALLQAAATNPDETIGFSQIILIGIGIAQGTGFGIGWKAFFVLHGFMCAGLVILGASLLKNPPAGWKPEGWTPPSTAKVSRKDANWNEMLDTPLASMMWLTFIFGATSGLMAIGQWKPMMGAILKGQTFAPAWLGGFGRFLEPVGILAIFNALGRVFWGKISDLLDRPRAMMIMYLAQGMAFMLLISVDTTFMIFLASAWVGLNFGGNFALFPSATSDYFGTKHVGINYGLIFTAYGVAGILGPVAGGVLFDSTQQYLIPFVFAGVLCFMAAATSVVVWMMGRTYLKEQAS